MLEALAHYKILDRVGAGGFGDVYRARDTRLGRTVAIKVLSPDVARHAARRQRFLADARAAAALSHPNIAAVYEVSEEKDLAYLVCEFVPGEPLTAVIASHSLNSRRAIDFAIQLADAVADAHAEGVVHRNLRSGTITVTPKDKIKVLDFGLAAWMKRGGAQPQPSSDDADYRADVQAVGAVLFEMLTGKQPPNSGKPVVVSATNPGIPKELDPIVAKALARTGDHRFESAATLAAELRSVAAILDVRSGEKEPPINIPARMPRRLVAPWLVVVLVLVALGGLLWIASRAA